MGHYLLRILNIMCTLICISYSWNWSKSFRKLGFIDLICILNIHWCTGFDGLSSKKIIFICAVLLHQLSWLIKHHLIISSRVIWNTLDFIVWNLQLFFVCRILCQRCKVQGCSSPLFPINTFTNELNEDLNPSHCMHSTHFCYK